LVTKADGIMGGLEERIPIYQDAERILVEDVGGAFLFCPVKNALWRPNLRGKAVVPNKFGITTWTAESGVWPFELYVGK
jgi:hypothetical protein